MGVKSCLQVTIITITSCYCKYLFYENYHALKPCDLIGMVVIWYLDCLNTLRTLSTSSKAGLPLQKLESEVLKDRIIGWFMNITFVKHYWRCLRISF